MGDDSNGNYSLQSNKFNGDNIFQQQADSDSPASSNHIDSLMVDIKDALNNRLNLNGSKAMTSDLNLGGNNLINVDLNALLSNVIDLVVETLVATKSVAITSTQSATGQQQTPTLFQINQVHDLGQGFQNIGHAMLIQQNSIDVLRVGYDGAQFVPTVFTANLSNAGNIFTDEISVDGDANILTLVVNDDAELPDTVINGNLLITKTSNIGNALVVNKNNNSNYDIADYQLQGVSKFKINNDGDIITTGKFAGIDMGISGNITGIDGILQMGGLVIDGNGSIGELAVGGSLSADFVNCADTLFTSKLNINDLATSPTGLVAGDVWNDNGSLRIV